MQLTRNFTLAEFKCRDGSPVPLELLAEVKLLAVQLQILRDRVQVPIKIVSAYRTLEYNRRIGSKDTSQHVLARAADIRVVGIAPESIAKIAGELMDAGIWISGGVGTYADDNFVHIDTRGSRAEWSG